LGGGAYIQHITSTSIKSMKDGVAGENTHSTSLHPLTKEEDFDTVPLELYLYLPTFTDHLPHATSFLCRIFVYIINISRNLSEE